MKHLLLLASLAITTPVTFASPVNIADDASPSTSSRIAEFKVNINTANQQQLSDALEGVGLIKAKAIIDYREQVGPFKRVDQLLNVEGIGEVTLRANRSKILL